MLTPASLDRLLVLIRAAGVRVSVTEEVRAHYLLASQPDLGADLPLALAAILAKSASDRSTLREVCTRWAEEAVPHDVIGANDSPDVSRNLDQPNRAGVASLWLRRWRRKRLIRPALLVFGLMVLSLGTGYGIWRFWRQPNISPVPIKDKGPSMPSEVRTGPTQYLIHKPAFDVLPPPHPIAGWLWLGVVPVALLSALAVFLLRRKDLALPKVTPAPIHKGPPRILPTLPQVGSSPALRLLDSTEQEAVVWGIGRFVSEERTRHLDVPKSVHATSRSAGLPQLVFQSARYTREVWLWLDDALPLDDPLRRLQEELSETLFRGGLRVEKALFLGVPDRLEPQDPVGDPVPFCAADVEDRHHSALICILTDGRLLGHRLSQNHTHLPVKALLRSLSHWPSLCFVDGSSDRSLEPHLQPFQLEVVSPSELPAFLTGQLQGHAERQPATVDLCGDLRAWAAACALAPFPLDNELAYEARTQLELRASPWRLTNLRAIAENFGSRFAFPPNLRARLLRFLVTAEGRTENSIYARALKLWRTILEKTASSLAANSPAQHRHALDVALLNLWDQPAEAAFALHRLTGAGLEPEIRREVCAYGLPHCTPPVIALPWAWQELNQNPQAQQILFQLGLQGIQEQITGIRRPARFPLVLAVLAILTVGAALRAWKPEKDTGAPTVQQVNAPPGAQAWAEPSGATYRVVAQHEKTRAEVQSPARARVTVRWVEKKQEEKTELADWCPYQETTDHGIVFVRVCAGEFTMGSAEEDQEAHPSEKPAHRVKLPEFWIGKYEVSNAQYRKHDPLHKSLSDGTDQPVNGITWTEARQFCESQGFRLPTEAEWEYAARGRDGRKYPWGDDPPTRSRAVYEVPGALGNPTSPSVVTSHSEGKGPFGTLHQAGNVWEWMEDCYESGGYLQQLDNHRDKEKGDSPVVSPVYWVKNCEHHTLRGGSFWDELWDLRSAGRRRRGSANQHERIGVRCVRAGSQ